MPQCEPCHPRLARGFRGFSSHITCKSSIGDFADLRLDLDDVVVELGTGELFEREL
jgi:hypothetical protein